MIWNKIKKLSTVSGNRTIKCKFILDRGNLYQYCILHEDYTMEENGDGTLKPTPIIEFDGMILPPFPPLREDVKKRFEEIRNLACRKDDIILATYPKSGTHWVWEIVCMLLKNKPEYSKEGKELLFLESIPDISMVDNIPSPRPFNTHIPYRWFPKQHTENGGKIIHVLRNPKDVAASFYHHARNTEEFGEISDFKSFYENVYVGSVQPLGGWFAYEKEFEQAEINDTHNAIFTVQYESLKKDPIGETKRLAKFLDVDVNDEIIAEIADKCSFRKLKEANATVKDHSRLSKLHPNAREIMMKMYRKGEIGDWKNHFTVAMNEQFDAKFKEEMKDSKIEVQYE
ncbi:sulfotransferase 1B1-like isoform X2 [Ostrea edulis]|uniref:sulfotransferase 1B1-like isoform X2 n=1 Tax=Ostrea edulis TaxID=37623 RepID=UPI0024AF07B1|nr:sulfotransferase 1B1-like isoform X2 [Ostrea edulis]